MAKNKLSFYETYSTDLLTYNAQDCVNTARIYQALQEEERWADPRVQKLHRFHVKLSKLAASMHTRGMKVHQLNRAFMIWALEREYYEKEAVFLNAVGIPGMRSTPDDLRSLIYRRHETKKIARFSLPDPFDPKMYTDEDLETISVDTASLSLLIAEGDCPPALAKIIGLYWAAESAWKSRTFLVSKKTEHAIGPDGRLRPSWNSCGTDTMRFSCRDPNVMQWEKMLRAMVGTDQGHTLVGMDKSQLEIRVGELVSEDDYLWKLLQTGDVYSEDVRQSMGLPPNTEVKKGPPELQQARQDYKIIRLASQYMAGLATVYAQYLASDPKVEFTKVKMLFERFHRVHAEGLIAYAHRELHWVSKHGYSEGRVLHGRRYYPREPPITEVSNWPIQRTASEMMNIEILRFWRRLRKEVPRAAIVLQMHDAIVVDTPDRYVNKVVTMMKEEFNTSYIINGRERPFPIEIKTGRTWDTV